MKNFSSDTHDKRLVGYIRRCGDDECPCIEPVIEMMWLQRAKHFVADGADIESWEPHVETVWSGTFQPDPASYDWEFAADELCGACERHKMERDTFERDRWEREL